MSQPAATVVPIANHPRFYTEGDLERLDVYFEGLRRGAEITELNHLDTESLDTGTLHRYGFIIAAGYAYNGNVIIPDKPTSGIPVFNTHAWGTGPRGHNEHTGRKLAEDGLANISVGNEGSYRPTRFVRPQQSLSLGLSSAAALSFAQKVAPEFKYLMDPVKRTATGESKGGMEGMGHLVLDRLFDQDVMMADYTAPCIPRKLEISDAHGFLQQVAGEPWAMARLGGRLAVGLITHYPATMDAHPYALAHQLAKGWSVFSGEAGDLGRLVPLEKILHLTTFTHDFASMRTTWEEIFAQHPHARITPLEGHHLTLADPETLAFIRARQRAFREILNQASGDISQVSGEAVFNLAHEYSDTYRPDMPQSLVSKVARLVFGNHPLAS